MNQPNHSDPLFDEQPQGMLSKLLPPLVLICAFGGFVALAIYAYKAGTQSVNDGELMVIEADKSPVKEKPEDPGGMQFPNQDKTIFETFSADGKQPPKVERVLPTPEEPIAEPNAWVNDKLTGQPSTPAAKSGAEEVFGDEDAPPTKTEEPLAPTPQAAPQAQVKNVQEELGKQAVAESKAEPVIVETPKSVVVAKPAPKKAAAAAKGLVQLGAYKSEAEAKADFAKMQKKYSVLGGKSPTINRADLGDKGVFFRLRVSTDDPKALCSTLSNAGQACMVVK